MFIGRLAELTGCTPKAIRLYEQMGLISEPEREGRYRLYNAHHLEIVHLIRKAQTAGFKLAEMNPLIAAKNKLKSFPLALANQAVDDKRQNQRRAHDSCTDNNDSFVWISHVPPCSVDLAMLHSLSTDMRT
ncbi:MerR family transcriptional regulator [Pseudomonas hefeiensis]|uniref:MerR family transcriptional regulator n=1 Tax=Pseudomonas hefeiensis TaxID=2738125 RepID=A0ABY9GGZ0_9PSED|nr:MULTISPECIES: MerR family transcriptional regulator [unclassified Pseudomonas]WLH14864.1 MerR family transcriptional regulator [Pseudomonas sp. FP205]WLH97914.1 MerR family transcriptional regulator [Pseudomonas sp. FP53]WLI42189.1 MerR family transcriptional regulator [Pseudomonas sp. FP821]